MGRDKSEYAHECKNAELPTCTQSENSVEELRRSIDKINEGGPKCVMLCRASNKPELRKSMRRILGPIWTLLLSGGVDERLA